MLVNSQRRETGENNQLLTLKWFGRSYFSSAASGADSVLVIGAGPSGAQVAVSTREGSGHLGFINFAVSAAAGSRRCSGMTLGPLGSSRGAQLVLRRAKTTGTYQMKTEFHRHSRYCFVTNPFKLI